MCMHCPNPMNVKKGHVKHTTHEDIIEQIHALKGPDIMFTGGGEPTMVPNLAHYMKYAKSLGFEQISLETNGMLLSYPEYVKDLKQAGLKTCVISLHSNIPEICDKITQVPGGFDKTIKGIQNLRKTGIELTMLLHTISSLNYKYVKDYLCFAKDELSVTNHGISFIRPAMNDKISESITPRISDIIKYLHKALDYANEHNIKVQIPAGLGIPACFMHGYEKHCTELEVYFKQGSDEHKKQSYAFEKTKPAKCKSCSLDACCAGLQKSYAKLYGTDELAPKNTDIEHIKALFRNKHILGRVQITRECNQDCVFCAAPPVKDEPTNTQIKEKIIELKEHGTTDILLTGGEPMLRNDLLDLIEFCAKRFPEITLQTNATKFTPEVLKKLSKYSGLKINFSMDTHIKDIYGKITGHPENFEKLINAVKLMGGLNISAHPTIVISSLNYKHLSGLVKFIGKELPHVRHLSINYIDPICKAVDNPWTVPKYSDSEKFIHDAVREIKKKNMSFRIEKLPLCFMKGFEEFSSDIRRDVFDEHRMMSFFKTENDTHLDKEFFIEKNSVFMYAEPCKKCSLIGFCPGVNPQYAKLHGTDELEQSTKDKETIISKIK